MCIRDRYNTDYMVEYSLNEKKTEKDSWSTETMKMNFGTDDNDDALACKSNIFNNPRTNDFIF